MSAGNKFYKETLWFFNVCYTHNNKVHFCTNIGYIPKNPPPHHHQKQYYNPFSVCVTGYRSMGYVWIMRWCISNLVQWPLRNLVSVAYCYIFILDPPHPLFPTSDFLLEESATSFPDTSSIEARRVSAQYHLPTIITLFICSSEKSNIFIALDSYLIWCAWTHATSWFNIYSDKIK